MAFPRNSLRAFLQHAKTRLLKAIHEDHDINIVIGNESAGLLVFYPWHLESCADIDQILIP